MHIKFLPHGKGLATAAVDYLVGERDAEGQRRDGVEVLRGNPDMVAAVADSLDFERKYTSVVIAWAPDDRPTDEQIEAVLDEFEKTAWAGLEPDRYAWTAVLHREIAVDAGGDLLVSVHNNAFPDGVDPRANHGTSVYYFHPPSAELARLPPAGIAGGAWNERPRDRKGGPCRRASELDALHPL